MPDGQRRDRVNAGLSINATNSSATTSPISTITAHRPLSLFCCRVNFFINNTGAVKSLPITPHRHNSISICGVIYCSCLRDGFLFDTVLIKPIFIVLDTTSSH